MKRSPLKRKGRLKAKRAKPRNHVNVKARRAYRADREHCEVSPHLWEKRDGKWVYLPAPDWGYGFKLPMPTNDVHHIFPNCKHDVLSNLICTGRLAHSYGHDHRADFTALCFWVKWRNGELDADETHSVTGKHLVGYLEGLVCEFEWGREKRDELLKHLKGAA